MKMVRKLKYKCYIIHLKARLKLMDVLIKIAVLSEKRYKKRQSDFWLLVNKKSCRLGHDIVVRIIIDVTKHRSELTKGAS